MSKKVRAVVVDDSAFVCRLITSYLQSSQEIEVVGTGLNGERAVELVHELRPDVVTLDLEMPQSNGFEAVQRIMAERPTPIVVISGVSGRAATMTLQALDCGALDFALKYTPGSEVDPAVLRREIISKVKQAATIRVVRTVARSMDESGTRSDSLVAAMDESIGLSAGSESWQGDEVYVIGASTGGPLALREILAQLPADFPAGIIIVQHMPAIFTGVLAAQLNRQSRIMVREAEAGDRPQPGLALVAPGGFHLLLDSNLRVRLERSPEIAGHRPSIDVAMQSVALICGPRARGVVLTGMGNDGARGLLTIKSRGGLTFAQDEASSVVFGMPKRAIEAGVVDHVAPPAALGQLLMYKTASQPPPLTARPGGISRDERSQR